MQGGGRSRWRTRPTAAILTLAAHALFVVLLLIEQRNAPRPEVLSRQLVPIPITLLPLVLTAEQEPAADQLPGGSPAPRPASAPLPLPATAITLAPSTPPVESAAPERSVDWNARSTEHAARFAERAESGAPTFSPPPAVMREPCKPRKKSFKFKEEQPSTNGIAMLTLGWEEPDADKHFFDDMKAGKGSGSSVPDPNLCD